MQMNGLRRNDEAMKSKCRYQKTYDPWRLHLDSSDTLLSKKLEGGQPKKRQTMGMKWALGQHKEAAGLILKFVRSF